MTIKGGVAQDDGTARARCLAPLNRKAAGCCRMAVTSFCLRFRSGGIRHMAAAGSLGQPRRGMEGLVRPQREVESSFPRELSI
jgi:hypothetical protein